MNLTERRTAKAAGYSDDELQRGCRTGELYRIRPGVYVEADGVEAADAVDRYRAAVVAAALKHGPGAVISHESAAALHGLRQWTFDPQRVHVTRKPPGGGKVSARRHLHRAPLPQDHVVELDGVAVTSVARTVVDIARTRPFENAVVVGDSAMRRGMARADAHAVLGTASCWKGLPAARRAIGFLDPRSDGVGESRSRVLLSRLGLAPDLKRDITAPDGTVLGPVDFCMPRHGLIGEFDGRVEYGRLLRFGADPDGATYAEKLREDALRDLGWQVVRWVWSELDTPDVIWRRLNRAIARGNGLSS
ncbi:MAG: hypothetical protein HOQ24_15955 [Mycobacteriaceae bacterium]|nr:hypothetical protein [Mycobacteriaceae bacterium]